MWWPFRKAPREMEALAYWTEEAPPSRPKPVGRTLQDARQEVVMRCGACRAKVYAVARFGLTREGSEVDLCEECLNAGIDAIADAARGGLR